MRRVLLTGGSGQLARAILMVAADSKSEYLAYSHHEADICDREVMERLIANDIDIVINCAAYTNVDGAEDALSDAEHINVRGVELLAELCSKYNARLIHISTDYVFGGDSKRNTPYTEEDSPAPINNYGQTKLDGERRALEYNKSIVIRTSWLYSPWGKNFVRTILRLAKERGELRVVNDQQGAPTSALSLARMLVKAIDEGVVHSMSGIYHYTNRGCTTWYAFAKAIVTLADVECNVEACSTSERPSKAQRPHYSALDCSRIERECGTTIIDWEEALEECIELIKQEDE